MQEEVEHLRVRSKSLEERTLDAMLAVEAAESEQTQAQEALDALTREQETYHAGLLEEKDKLLGQAKVLQVKRQRSITELPWADLQAYERLRRSKAGVAIAAVRGGLCTGCRVAVPATVMRQARSGTELTPCPTCGRILYPLGEAKYTAFDHDLDNIDR
jgi:predicted  nucleic acid-binding Zn-ribbon protein